MAAWAARLYGARAAILTAAAYATVPFVALGSLLISTDTVMAPFFAAALYAHHRLLQTRAPKFALWAGVAIGAAFMAKYAAIYFLIGVALAAVRPEGRIGWRNAALMLLAFAVVISGNLIWNISHQFTTLSHTVDNVGWVRQDNPLAALNFASAAEFILSQFAVAGPVIFAAILLAIRKLPIQAAFVMPPLLVVTVQALLGTAQANWAVAAYFAGIPLAIGLLQARPALAGGIFRGERSVLHHPAVADHFHRHPMARRAAAGSPAGPRRVKPSDHCHRTCAGQSAYPGRKSFGAGRSVLHRPSRRPALLCSTSKWSRTEPL